MAGGFAGGGALYIEAGSTVTLDTVRLQSDSVVGGNGGQGGDGGDGGTGGDGASGLPADSARVGLRRTTEGSEALELCVDTVHGERRHRNADVRERFLG